MSPIIDNKIPNVVLEDQCRQRRLMVYTF